MNDRFQLKKFVAKNFKAVRESGEITFGSLTALIGNNGSGKSSLVEGIEVYRELVANGLDAAFDRWYGVENAWNKAARHQRQVTKELGEHYSNPISFRLQGEWKGRAFNGMIELTSETKGKNRAWIQRESLKLPRGRLYRRDQQGRCESFNDKDLSAIRTIGPTESAAPQDWKDFVGRWAFLRLDPNTMGAPHRARRAQPFPVLESDGANIAQYLLSFREESLDAFNDFIDAVRFVVPYARELRSEIADLIERRAYLEMTEGEFNIPGWLLSTGTLRIVSLLACLRHPTPPPLLVIEEVENGLDPRTLHMVVEEIRAAITLGTTQVILTTHSPYLLDLLALEHIVVVERVDGVPVFTRPDQHKLAGWAESFSPGRLYTMGRLTRND